MNVKSLIVGFVIAVVASMGTYFLVPPPRDADAGLFISRAEMWNILEACKIQIYDGRTRGHIRGDVPQKIGEVHCLEPNKLGTHAERH